MKTCFLRLIASCIVFFFFLFLFEEPILASFVFASEDSEAFTAFAARELVSSLESQEALLDNSPTHFDVASGVGSNSIFHFFDAFSERISLLLSFSSEKKALKLLRFRHERLEEFYELLSRPKYKKKELEHIINDVSVLNQAFSERFKKETFDAESVFGEYFVSVRKEEDFWQHNVLPVLLNAEDQELVLQVQELMLEDFSRFLTLAGRVSYSTLDHTFAELFASGGNLQNEQASYEDMISSSRFSALESMVFVEKLLRISQEQKVENVERVLLVKREELLINFSDSLSRRYGEDELQMSFERWILHADYDYVSIFSVFRLMENSSEEIFDLDYEALRVALARRISFDFSGLSQETVAQLLHPLRSATVANIYDLDFLVSQAVDVEFRAFVEVMLTKNFHDLRDLTGFTHFGHIRAIHDGLARVSKEQSEFLLKSIDSAFSSLYTCLERKECEYRLVLLNDPKNILLFYEFEQKYEPSQNFITASYQLLLSFLTNVSTHESFSWFMQSFNELSFIFDEQDWLELQTKSEETTTSFMRRADEYKAQIAHAYDLIKGNQELVELFNDNEPLFTAIFERHLDGYNELITHIQESISFETTFDESNDLRAEIRRGFDNPPLVVNTLALIDELEHLLENIEFTKEQQAVIDSFLRKLNEKVTQEGYVVIQQQIKEYFSSLSEELQEKIRAIEGGEVLLIDESSDENDASENLSEEEILQQEPVTSDDVEFDDNTDQSETYEKDDFLFE